MMLKSDPNFTRLKKLGGRGYLGRVSYWLGVDHLLVVEVTNYNERYRRFYFRDIQAVIVQRNRNCMWGNIVAGVIAILPALGAVALLNDGEYAGASLVGGILVLIGVFIMANTLRGPMCSVHLRTAVQTQKLANIDRWQRAEFLIETLTPLIQSLQVSAGEAQSPIPATVSNPPAASTDQPDFS